jgi:hypothetical protein
MSENIESPPEEHGERLSDLPGLERAELEEATHEPEARVEQRADYAEAEAIESAMADLVEAASELHEIPEQQPLPGETQGELTKHYSGVELTQGDVARDQDWNEGQGSTGTEAVACDGSSKLDADEVGVLESAVIPADDGANRFSPGERAGKAEVLEGRDREVEELPVIPKVELPGGSPLEEVAKVDAFTQGADSIQPGAPADLGLDHKPIPAEQPGDRGAPSEEVAKIDSFTRGAEGIEATRPGGLGGEVALDGKGDDVTPTLDGKGNELDEQQVIPKIEAAGDASPPEAVIPKLEADGSMQPIEDVIPKLDLGVSWKFDEGLSAAGAENLEPILGRAVTDPPFRERLVQDYESAIEEYDLTPDEQGMLAQIDFSQLEALARELETRFMAADNPGAQDALGRLFSQLLWGSGK